MWRPDVNALCATVTGNNDCSAHRNTSGHWSHWIGASNITWISQDFYVGGDDADADRADYERYLFRKSSPWRCVSEPRARMLLTCGCPHPAYLRPDQKAVLVPQAWVPAKQSDNSSAVADWRMAGNTLRHMAWGMEDERVAAIIPFALGCGHALPAVTCAWNFWGKELMDEAMVTRFYQAFSAGFAPRLPRVDSIHSQ